MTARRAGHLRPLDPDENVHSAPTELGVLIKRLRLQRRMSQQQVADAAGLTQTTVTHIETGTRGKQARAETILQVAHGLKASLEETKQLLRAGGHVDAAEVLGQQREPFESWLARDPRLTRADRDLLVALYERLVRR